MNIDWSVVSTVGVIVNAVLTVIIIAVLIFLYRLFNRISSRLSPDIMKRMKKRGRLFGKESGRQAVPADHSAAIALALYLNNELHDEESNILTIERVSRIYSPWSSKYYNMRKAPR